MINLFRKCSGIIGIFILLMLTLSLTGCGAGRTMVLAPVETPVKFTSAELYEDKATVNVPGDSQRFVRGQARPTSLWAGWLHQGSGPQNQVPLYPIQSWQSVYSLVLGGHWQRRQRLHDRRGQVSGQQRQRVGKDPVGRRDLLRRFRRIFDFAIQKTAEEVTEYAKRFR